ASRGGQRGRVCARELEGACGPRGTAAALWRRSILLRGASGLRAAAGCRAALVDAARGRREVQRARAGGVNAGKAGASLALFRVRIQLISNLSGRGAAGRTTSDVLRGPRTRSPGRPVVLAVVGGLRFGHDPGTGG